MLLLMGRDTESKCYNAYDAAIKILHNITTTTLSLV